MTSVRTRVGAISVALFSISVLGGCSSSSDSGSEPIETAAPQPAGTEPATDTSEPVTEPSGPVYAFAQAEDGSSWRFDACSGPIRILLNTGDLQDEVSSYTDVDVTAQIGELLTQAAAELAEVTGFEIEYAGTTDIALSDELADKQVIVLNFGSTGFPGREDSLFEQKAIFATSKDGVSQIVSFQHFESSLGFYIHFQEGAKLAGGARDVGIDDAGKRWLKTILGEALGLRQLTDADMIDAGVAEDARGAEIMYTDSYKEKDGVYNLTWGEGDKAGLVAVGATNECF
ncbi:MAG: hypothetical protein ACKOI2_06045 [Actinomycetota bacterium]